MNLLQLKIMYGKMNHLSRILEESAHDEAVRRSRESMERYITDMYTREDFRDEYTVGVDPASLSEDTSSTVIRGGEGLSNFVRDNYLSSINVERSLEEDVEEINTIFPDELLSNSDEEELLPED